ncbi:MAG: hypothetical protein MUQ27_01065 [Acidimicrobiia bacterium]|nr:hypothetical protein [Acidimicrobiia bacterium]
MDGDVAAWKLAVVYAVWLLASAAIALIAGLLVGEIAMSFGVESRSSNHLSLIATVAAAAFIVLAALPFLLRRRMSRSDEKVPD